MNFNVRKLRLQEDALHLQNLDASFESNVVLSIADSATGFSFTEKSIDPPFKKSFLMSEILSELRESDSADIAEIDDIPRAFAAISYEKWNRRAILRHLYVDKAFRRRGLAKALLTAMLAEAGNFGARCLWIETQNTNFPAIQFYKANGFECCGLDRSLYDANRQAIPEWALFFVKELEK